MHSLFYSKLRKKKKLDHKYMKIFKRHKLFHKLLATYIFLNFSNQEGEESYPILQSPFDRHPLIFRKLQFLINFQILTRPLMGQAEFSCRDRSASSASSQGSFNNYVDKMRGEGVKKYLFLSTLRVKKLSTQGGGQKMAKFFPRSCCICYQNLHEC